jgi:hypothetical protein
VLEKEKNKIYLQHFCWFALVTIPDSLKNVNKVNVVYRETCLPSSKLLRVTPNASNL